jgi:hypothetical protein
LAAFYFTFEVNTPAPHWILEMSGDGIDEALNYLQTSFKAHEGN